MRTSKRRAHAARRVVRYGSFAWQMISHKLCRWLVPLFLAIAGIGTALLAGESVFFTLLFALMVAFTLLAFVALVRPEYRRYKIYKIPLFFLVTNAAIAVAWTQYLTGRRAVSWTPSAKGA